MNSAIPSYLLPDTSATDKGGQLSIGGCNVIDLAEKYGTPLFVYDEQHIRNRAREAVEVFPNGATYASKAFLCKAVASLVYEEGMSIDVSTGGELAVAIAAEIPGEKIVLHGNNKSDEELKIAVVDYGVGRIVVDSFDEITRLERLADNSSSSISCLVRVTPGVEAHTHEFVQTGQADSKFGFGIANGQATEAIQRLQKHSKLNLLGIHVHIGSQIFRTDSFSKAISIVAPLIKEFSIRELSIGGGLGVPYVEGESAPSITEWGKTIQQACSESSIDSSVRITTEPGRSIVAASAITLYTVGTIKEISDIRTYVSIDGGMSDNPRPVLYGSGYETFLPRCTNAERSLKATAVGKHCESGDVVVRDAKLPQDLRVGDILATPVTGAYGHSMASNYNKVPRPAVVFVKNGEDRVVVKRESYEDLLKNDL